ncbi:hypothetical protein [Halomonas alkalisoli]|uniref:hypothetical protein n=1 Tax=Halomonas alkalisoli TaxID=2907158 RepID=UPI001F3EC9A9|nr:hypothetical protein [Halomonas alkalisoli]MCE9681142.1 hypothetical protein [Halomonas alkalisoli]
MELSCPTRMIDDEVEALEKGKLTAGIDNRYERIEVLQKRLNILNILRSRLPPRERRTKALRELDKRVLATILEVVNTLKEERAIAKRQREKRRHKNQQKRAKKFARKLTPAQRRELAEVDKRVAELKRQDAQAKEAMEQERERRAREARRGNWVQIFQGGAPSLGKRR